MTRTGRLTLAGVVVGMLLVALGYHLYFYDYGIGMSRQLPRVRTASAELAVAVELPAEPVRPRGPCPVTVSLTNRSGRRLTIADLSGPAGLLRISMTRDGLIVPPGLREEARLAPWSRELDAAVDLLPGASYSRTVDVGRLYSLAPGEYVLSVSYDPEAYFAAKGLSGKKLAGIWVGMTPPAEAAIKVDEE